MLNALHSTRHLALIYFSLKHSFYGYHYSWETKQIIQNYIAKIMIE